jgi:predicted small integral membrane protein
VEWMAWTPITAAFFAAIGLLIAALTVWAVLSPSTPRKGFLPMPTARGDRVFLGLLGSAFIHLAWIGLTEAPIWGAALLSLLYVFALCRWG